MVVTEYLFANMYTKCWEKWTEYIHGNRGDKNKTEWVESQ